MCESGKINIALIDDDELIRSAIKNVIHMRLNNVEVIEFECMSNDFISDFQKEKFDLVVTDVSLGQSKLSHECLQEIIEECDRVPPILFISGLNYSFETFQNLKCVYDFIDKPFNSDVFVNRIKLLLRVSDKSQKLRKEIISKNKSLWDIFNYSNFYVCMLNQEFQITLANYYLSHQLGFEEECDLIGKNFREYVPESFSNIMPKIFDGVLQTHGETHDFVCEIMDPNTKVEVTVKWFISFINTTINSYFMIGIPLLKDITPQDSVETIRQYWRNIIERDRSTIKSLKETVMASK